MSITIKIPYPVLYILNTLKSQGHEAYIVGGAVRDILLNIDPVIDWDVTTNATPEKTLSLFNESFYDNNFGTVMVDSSYIMEQAEKNQYEYPHLDVFDITTFRNEDGYSNSRHPDTVTWGQTLEEDVSRRDFTINALAFEIENIPSNPAIDEKGYVSLEVELLDYYGGAKDLDQGIIRTVLDPVKRFSEDALRLMRAVRFATVLDFEIEAATLEALIKTAEGLSKISQERIRDELFKILASDRPVQGIELLDHAKLLPYILPELEQTKGVIQGGRHKYDVWKHSLESLRECPSSDPLVRLATLLHDIGKPRTIEYQGPRGVTFYGHEVVGAHMVKEIADRLRLSKKDKQKLFILVRWHMFTYSKEMTDSAIRRFIRRVGVENINDMINLRIGDRKGGGSKSTSWRLRELQERIGQNLYEPMSVKDLKIDGHILMEKLELKPSPIVGKILNQLFELVMDDQLENNEIDLLNKAKELKLGLETSS